MKIIFIDFDDIKNPLLGAGQAKATLEVGSRLAKKGHTIEVISSRYPGSYDRLEYGIRYKHIGIGTKHIRLNNAIYILSLPFIVPLLKADIIIECFTAPISTLCTQLFTNIPVVGIPTSFEADRFSKLYKFPFNIIEKLGLKTYKYFLPYTKDFANRMRASNPKASMRIVPEGVGEEFFTYKKGEAKHILFIGRFDVGQKGIDLLIKSYAKVANKLKLPLIIAGLGPDEMKIKSYISKHDMDKHIFLQGPAFGKEKEKLLSHALFVAFPSRHEGFSLFSLEALASGNGLAAFDIPGLSWTNENVVLKAKPFDTEDYASILLKLSEPRLAKKMGTQSRLFSQKYTWDNVVKQYEEFFLEIVNRRK